MSRIKDLRMKLTPEDIRNTLTRLGIEPHEENDNEIIYPTVCHNETGGSPKLYYWKNEKIFKCFTQCPEMFDIFELLKKIKKLRGQDITLPQAIAMTGVEDNSNVDQEILDDLAYLRKLSKANELVDHDDDVKLEILNKNILNAFDYNKEKIQGWIDEGIGEDALERFNIKYDPNLDAIIIPNLDHEGNLIGIRGRFLAANAKAKYMPIRFNGKILSHPTGKFLYGFYENKNVIAQKRIAVIFEGEKSVLKMETMYPGNNVALSTSGKKITLDQLNALLKMNINEVVLAYDKEYQSPDERKAKIVEYDKIISVLKPYFEVSMLIDFSNHIPYKESPIDAGKDVFEDLMRNRMKR